MDALDLRAPFPWFGGKRKAAKLVWPAFDPRIVNYVEPFLGSAAMLLGRPGGPGKIETVNDIDRYVANFWRAVVADPWAVAAWCDAPVNEADLHARHRWLVGQSAELRRRMHEDPDYCDPKIAGWWVWGICSWIGGGWCAEPNNHKRPRLDGIGKGVHSKARNLKAATRPRMSGDNAGEGVHRPPDKLPAIAVKADGACAGRGVHSEPAVASYSPGRRPDLSNDHGVHLPSLGNDRGVHGVRRREPIPGTFLGALHELAAPDTPPCFWWFQQLLLRLRRVRVACGDWKRVLGDSVLGKGKRVGGRRPCAVFLDPPYPDSDRAAGLYNEDDGGVFYAVRDWALEHGDDPDLRIAVCGYEDGFEWPKGWSALSWNAGRGYAGDKNDNRERERIWLSPHCIRAERDARQTALW